MDTEDLVERLLTIAGSLMEDASAVAIILSERPFGERARIVIAAGAGAALIGMAALILSALSSDKGS